MSTKQLPIRLWLGLALVLIVGMPMLAMSIVAALSVRDQTVSLTGVTAVRQALTDNIGQWTDPSWQAGIRTELAAADTDVVLFDASGQEVYRSTPDPLASPLPTTGVMQYTTLPIGAPPSPSSGNIVYFGTRLIRP